MLGWARGILKMGPAACDGLRVGAPGRLLGVTMPPTSPHQEQTRENVSLPTEIFLIVRVRSCPPSHED